MALKCHSETWMGGLTEHGEKSSTRYKEQAEEHVGHVCEKVEKVILLHFMSLSGRLLPS